MTNLIGQYFKASHPSTCLNPNEYNAIVDIRVEWCSIENRIKTYVRGECTMWFADSVIDHVVAELEK